MAQREEDCAGSWRRRNKMKKKGLREHERRPRWREEGSRRARKVRAEQLQAERHARAQRQPAEESEQQLLQRALKGSRTHSVLAEATPSHRPREEMFRQEVRDRTSEATL